MKAVKRFLVLLSLTAPTTFALSCSERLTTELRDSAIAGVGNFLQNQVEQGLGSAVGG